ncbi:MAG: class I SAM-dependent rRNA methyltransferase [Candidatus Omnitrophica bacterium]|nr:class I SAM-dependent rRNA methyltransferase [Candidatus Omnitrophota bacterium]
MVTVTLNPQQEEHIASGNTFIFTAQINNVSGAYNPGDIVDVRSFEKKFLGRGYINPAANVAVRLLTRNDEPVDKEFFIRRLQQALALRRTVLDADTTLYRLVFSESDYLPGLIIDVYGGYLVLQTLTLGMEQRRDLIVDCLRELIHPKGIYLRNDTQQRVREGLLLEKRALSGKFPAGVEVKENGINFRVDVENGQKTGFYIDRRSARQLLRPAVRHKRILDCFCYNGSFSVYAQAYGAAWTTGIDISAHALKQAENNMRANNIDSRKYSLLEADVFESLKILSGRKEKFDVVVIDPPGFSSARHKADAALRSYRELHARVLGVLQPGGLLVTACASYHVDDDSFRRLLLETAHSAGRSIRMLGWATQPADHPSLLHKKETAYFKCLLAEVS